MIRDLNTGLSLFYAWQHGMGYHEKLPKEQELMQLPGRGSLDFLPILTALKRINYSGWTEIFMHPVPRGIPIMDSKEEVTDEINRARSYMDTLISAA
jgi:sugar phosphate isomerase/epimerase